MKIYRPLHILSGDLWGGAEAQVHLLCKGTLEYCSKQIMPSVFLFNHGALEEKLLATKVTTKISSEKNGLWRLIVDAFNFAKNQKSNLLISHGYKEGIVAYVVSKAMSLPWIHFIHGTSENYTGLKKYKMAIYSGLERFLMRASAKRIVTVSKKISLDLGINSLTKHRVIYNAAENPSSRGSVTSKSFQANKISWLGRLSPVKRPDLAILGFQYFLDHSLTKEPSMTLDIYGTGPLEGELKNLSNGNARINLCGFTNNPEMIISESSLILLTSDSEGIPTVLLEAMHSNVPIVTRLVGGIPEIISLVPDYPIIKIKDGTSEATGLAIQEAINSLDDLQSKAKECNTDYFKVARLIEDHLNLYREIA